MIATLPEPFLKEIGTQPARPVPAPWRVTVDETANDQPGGCPREAI
jgi:hypothetical protein